MDSKDDLVSESKYILDKDFNYDEAILTLDDISKIFLELSGEIRETEGLRITTWGRDAPESISIHVDFKRPMTPVEIKRRDDLIKREQAEKLKEEKALKKKETDALKKKESSIKSKIAKVRKNNPDLKDVSDDVIKKILEIK